MIGSITSDQLRQTANIIYVSTLNKTAKQLNSCSIDQILPLQNPDIRVPVLFVTNLIDPHDYTLMQLARTRSLMCPCGLTV